MAILVITLHFLSGNFSLNLFELKKSFIIKFVPICASLKRLAAGSNPILITLAL